MQELLDDYFLKARGANNSLRDRDACKGLAGPINDKLQQVRGGLEERPLQSVKKAKAGKSSADALGAANKHKGKRGEPSVAAPKADAVQAALSRGKQRRGRTTSSVAAPKAEAAAQAQAHMRQKAKKGPKQKGIS